MQPQKPIHLLLKIEEHYMKALALIILTLITTRTYAQLPLNAYKYAIVPERYAFSKEDNQYGLATITKLQLEDKGFVVFREKDALPQAVALNKCLALKVEVVERKTLFSTNLTVYLKDCQGNTIFKSKEGKSREKEFEQSYPLALSDAFASLYTTPYKYDSTLAQQPAAIPQPQQAASAPQPQQAAAQPQQTTAMVTPTPAIQTPPTTAQPVPAQTIQGTLYAQPIPNGYQLIDTTPKKVLTLLKTSAQDCYIAGPTNGIVFKKDGAWYFEYYQNDKLTSQKLDIKF